MFMENKKLKINEIIVVEGRDDTRAVKRAIICQTIETHGFGISKETFEAIKTAYESVGIIVFTDPDFAGEKIRKRLMEKFPKAKQAYLTRDEANSKGDIGIENASEEAIIEAIKKVRTVDELSEKKEIFSILDLQENGLIGLGESREKRQKLGKILGIGYSNGNGILKKLNGFQISREEFEKAMSKIDEEF